MSILKNLFSGSRRREARSLAEERRESQEWTRRMLGPILAVAKAIISTSNTCLQFTVPLIHEENASTRSEKVVDLLNEFLFFFMYLTSRRGSVLLGDAKARVLHGFLATCIIGRVIDTYSAPGQEEMSRGMRSHLYNRLNSRMSDYHSTPGDSTEESLVWRLFSNVTVATHIDDLSLLEAFSKIIDQVLPFNVESLVTEASEMLASPDTIQIINWLKENEDTFHWWID